MAAPDELDWISTDVLIDKPRCAALFNIAFYRRNGWRLPDNWQTIKQTGLTRKKKKKSRTRSKRKKIYRLAA